MMDKAVRASDGFERSGLQRGRLVLAVILVLCVTVLAATRPAAGTWDVSRRHGSVAIDLVGVIAYVLCAFGGLACVAVGQKRSRMLEVLGWIVVAGTALKSLLGS